MNARTIQTLGLVGLLSAAPVFASGAKFIPPATEAELVARLVELQNREAVVIAELYRLGVEITRTNRDIAEIRKAMSQTRDRRVWFALQRDLHDAKAYLDDITANRDDLLEELPDLLEEIQYVRWQLDAISGGPGDDDDS